MDNGYETLRQQLKIHCQQCSGLCCVALFFSKMDGFPENKRAGIACRHLSQSFQCHIYSELSKRHMKGCLAYDCFGAGQLVTQKFSSWKQENAQDIFDAFYIVSQLQQMLCYLIDAQLFCNNPYIHQLIVENEKIKSLPLKQLLKFDVDDYHQRVTTVLKPLCQQNKPYQKQSQKIYRSLDFSMQNLIGQDFSKCVFSHCTFLGTDIRDAHFEGTDLSQSLFLTQVQLNGAYGDECTKIPFWLNRPKHWRKENGNNT